VVAALAAGLAFTWAWDQDEREVLNLYGNVDIREVDLAFRVGGRIREMVFEEGDSVRPGEVVARLDARPYQDEVALARSEVAGSRAKLAKLEAGTRPQEIERARAVLAQREARERLARRHFERQKVLYERGDVSEAVLDEARAAYAEANALVSVARQDLSLAEEGPRQEDITAAIAEVGAAVAAAEQAETALRDTILRSPSAGTILSRLREPGAIVSAGGPVYTLTLAEPVRIRAYVAEPDLGLLSPGQRVTVVTDTRPDAPYEGHVGFISPTAEFTPRTVQTEELRTDLVYRLHVIVDEAQGLRQGMPVTVRVPLHGNEEANAGEGDGA
jgi:HlyD family secretion protein